MMCLCVFVKKDLKNTMLGEILKEKKFPHLDTFFLLEDSACVAIIVIIFFNWITIVYLYIYKHGSTKNHVKEITIEKHSGITE